MAESITHPERPPAPHRAVVVTLNAQLVASSIVDLAHMFGADDDGVSSLPVSQEHLASWIGVSRETVGRAVALMRSRGWLETRRGIIAVTDYEAVRARALRLG